MSISAGASPGARRLTGLGMHPLAAGETSSGSHAIRRTQASYRARNRATAAFLRDVHVAGRATRTTSFDELDMFSGDEVAAGLGCSRTMARRWLDLADDLLRRLPSVLALMDEGALDDTKARVLSDWTRDLSSANTELLLGQVLPIAPGVTVAALIDRIQDLAVALDPAWAARREARAKRHARLVATPNPSGTATLAGYDLPADDTACALSRVEALAATVHDRGIRIPIDQLRTVIYLRLLDGFAENLDDRTLVLLLVEHLRDHPDNPDRRRPDDGPEPDGPEPDGPEPDGPEPDGPEPDGPEPDGPEPDGPEPDGPEPDDDPPGDGPHPDDPHPDDPGPDEPAGGAPEDDADSEDPGNEDPDGEEADADEADHGPESFSLRPPPTKGMRRGTIELRLRLSTALGLDDFPARIPAGGPLTAPTARRLLDRLHRSEWRLVLTSPEGHLEHVLLTRHRPRPPGPRSARGQRAAPSTPAPTGIVELQVPTALLATLDPDAHPEWALLLRGARRRLQDLPVLGQLDPDVRSPDQARRRRARAELDRLLRVRDRHCIGVTCRRPARHCEIDHTRDWAFDGPTVDTNLGCVCGHDHRLKHHGGWILRQPGSGTFVWTSRTGLTYLRDRHPVTEPLPHPRPSTHGTGVHPVWAAA